MKIYTKTGDKGLTSLIGGTRVPKHHIRIEAYGTIDELNSWIGVIRDCITEEKTKQLLIQIQDQLFTIGSQLASDPEKSHMKLPEITDGHVAAMETEMDAIDKVAPPMRNFVLPGGHLTVSYCHVARCVCRRAERCVIHLSESEPVEEIIIRYINRLSDYLFMLSRKLTHELGAEEIPWIPAKK
ncbi:MAG TPA: cob(I)yrinic acid a,c-diamide adenosyltransferase [Bacteroidia bacterium]|nr:cob(I)yrinic acid a,c-diamide adenosyltransferase [Bacteroidia bacterium]